MKKEKYLTSTQVAKLLGTNRDTLSRWAKNGKFVPAYITITGYKYYTEEQVQHFIAECKARAQMMPQMAAIAPAAKLAKETKKNEVVQEKSKEAKKPKRPVGRPRKKTEKPKVEKPLFKLYVDAGTGKTWTNFYAMRSGKINSLFYISNPKVFSEIKQTFNGEEITAEENGESKYQFNEQMHGVMVTLGDKELDNVNATIAKGVFWIQLSFTNALGHNHPTDEEIEKARFMKWNISDFMEYCHLSDRRNAIESMKKMLSVLRKASIQWQEEVIDRDENGKPIVTGKYRDKDGRMRDKIKKSKHTYEGSFISTRDLNPVGGGFEYWINKEFAKYLAHAGVIAVHEKIFEISAQRNANAISLAAKLQEYHSMNKDKSQSNIISVKSLLTAMPAIPKYEDLTSDSNIIKDNGKEKTYTKQGANGGWRVRIQKPFEDALEALVDVSIITEWSYKENPDPKSYEEFYSQYIDFKLGIQASGGK